jgi:hypothetical protein
VASFVGVLGRAAVIGLLLGPVGCKKRPPVALPTLAEDALLTAMRSRPSLDPAQARFSVKLASKPLGITAPPLGGGLIVDRPGMAWVTVLNPLGGPVFTVASDGQQVAMVNSYDKQFVHADDASEALIGATGGAIRLDDVVGLLQGLVPIEPAKVRARRVVEGGVEFVAEGPAGTTLTTVVEEVYATPLSVVVTGGDGATLVTATYEPFLDAEGVRVPSRVTIFVPSVELTVDVKFKSWVVPESLPDVFAPTAPEGFLQLTFAEYAALMKAQQAERQR